ncbi:acyl carrier protein [Kitasatospora sp. MAP5-34]|uniref:acyl carrier protein n=1 Tax=Kitasatospora sp. MAP5-34 TaxID=3035102 RepID=UPI002476EEB7|nr:acyl carrier protein [Kitasatospora sp. MAP5-34]MDH6575408.1 acyl carrier protein [Kitasatospora sp. MAP5-34]
MSFQATPAEATGAPETPETAAVTAATEAVAAGKATSDEAVFDELKGVLLSIGLDEEQLTPGMMREEAGLDSLAVAELVLVLRREHGVAITEEEVHDAATLGEIAELVGRSLVASR